MSRIERLVKDFVVQHGRELRILSRLFDSVSVLRVGSATYRVEFWRRPTQTIYNLLSRKAILRICDHCINEIWKLGIYNVSDIRCDTDASYFDLEVTDSAIEQPDT